MVTHTLVSHLNPTLYTSWRCSQACGSTCRIPDINEQRLRIHALKPHQLPNVKASAYSEPTPVGSATLQAGDLKRQQKSAVDRSSEAQTEGSVGIHWAWTKNLQLQLDYGISPQGCCTILLSKLILSLGCCSKADETSAGAPRPEMSSKSSEVRMLAKAGSRTSPVLVDKAGYKYKFMWIYMDMHLYPEVTVAYTVL